MQTPDPIVKLRISRLAEVCREEIWVRGQLPRIAETPAISPDGAAQPAGAEPNPLPAGRTAVAVVGARAASRRALEQAAALGAGLGARGAVVVSGGAVGVDAAAHRGALRAGGQTVAVLGTGVDVPYPARHRALFDAIAAGGGALVSPFPPGTEARSWHFPRRNRLIAALAHGVVVVEAQVRSGALSTARAARELGRRVMAVPGSAGCDALLASGAFAVASPDDVLAALEGRRRARTRPEGDLGRVLGALSPREPTSVALVSERTGLPPLEVHSALLRLVLMGYVAQLAGERYKPLETVA